MKEDIVISGISGRFPESSNIEEFWTNLVQGVDMVTSKERRWPQEFLGVPARMGTLKNKLEDFDAEFFNVSRRQAERLDPQIRQLLEVTWECLLDGGFNPSILRGKAIGVYVGASSQETLEAFRDTSSTVSGYDITGATGCMFSNRISYAFDFNGPSVSMDTYCSSSLMAFHTAVTAIQNGECEGAVVGGVNLLLNPLLSLQMKQLGTLSPDGKCKSFDALGDGYVRSEGIVAIFLTKKSLAKRIYATVLHTKANADGYKENGVSFPSRIAQEKLIHEVYEEVGIDEREVFYIEAHGTGTSAGDGQELLAISSIFCKNRTSENPLLIGSVKSNMGHAETAASLCAVAKVALSIQRGFIPGNLHFVTPNPHIPALLDGRMKVVTENTVISGSIFGINASGIGGSNIHVVLKNEATVPICLYSKKLPLLVPFSGRTNDSVTHGLQQITQDQDFSTIHLMHLIHEQRLTSHDSRGFALLDSNSGDSEISISSGSHTRPSLWFIFPGMGTQWTGMAREIIEINIIRKSLETSAEILRPLGINLMHLLLTGTEELLSQNLSLCFAAVGVALVDFLKSLDLSPDGFIGHSAGELICAYVDGCVSQEETLMVFYHKDKITRDHGSDGGMAAVGLTWEEAVAQCPPNVYPACHNAQNNVTVSGHLKDLTPFVENLKAKGIFVKEIYTGGIAYHSPLLEAVAHKYLSALKNILKNPKPRSSKWISTSLPQSQWETSLARTFSPDYFINNFLSPVYFHEAVKQIPSNSIVLEVGSHSVFKNILKKTLPEEFTIVSLMKQNAEDNLKRIYSAIGTLFLNGLQPKLVSMYPEVTAYPIKSSASISSFVKWKHSEKYPLLDYKPSTNQHVVKISLDDDKYQYLKGHKINGRILFPATGYLVLVWKAYGTLLNKSYQKIPVQFDDVIFQKATVLRNDSPVEFHINFFTDTGDFLISEHKSPVVSGRIKLLDSETSTNLTDILALPENGVVLEGRDVYKDFRLRGYEYSGAFQGIIASTITGNIGSVRWQDEWTSFLDTVIQTSILSLGATGLLYLPTRFKKVVIDHAQLHQYKENHGSILPTNYSNLTQTVSTVGIEFKGLKLSYTPERKMVQPVPLIQDWQFIRYMDFERIWEFSEAIKICIDIVLENVTSNNVSIDENYDSTQANESILSLILKIVDQYPQRKVAKSQMPSYLQIVDSLEKVKTARILENGFILYLSKNLPNLDEIETDLIFVATLRTSTTYLYLLRKKKLVKSRDLETTIDVTNEKYNWLEPLKKIMSHDTKSSRIWLTSSEPESGLIGFVNCLRKEEFGESLRYILSQNDLPNFFKKQIEDSDLVANVIDSNGFLGSYRSIVRNLVHRKISTKYAYLDVLTKGDLTSVQWIEAPAYDSRQLCQVYYAALNFRDIMLAVGKLSPDSIPGNIGKQNCLLGLEFVGLDTSSTRVMGVVGSMGLATHVVADSKFIWTVPDHWSMIEAATVPIAYSTAYYALVVRGQLKNGESILITSGSGGVGQAAIAIARSYNCTVFTTVGSEEKKRFLVQRFPWFDVDKILNSRTTEFETKVLRATNNGGVDVVLNSLAEEKLQAAVRVLAIGGRFLEIGKFDLANNTALGMEIFLRNISFHGILLDSLFSNNNGVASSREKSDVVTLVTEGIQSGVVQPLPRRIFGLDEAEDAFRFMASGKHIGKVILQIRDENVDSPLMLDVIPKTYFHSDKLYLIIGGFGGFGLEIISWFINRGVRIVAIVSTSGVRNGYQALQIQRWKDRGVKVLTCTKNLSTLASVQSLLEEYSTVGPIGGIFNLAMVLRDELLENQTTETFEAVVRPKCTLTHFFDEASRLCCPILDYFVTFSSVSSLYGNAGQSNYGLANSSMERICENRRKQNLPGLTIAWGAVADVGVVYEKIGNKFSLIGGTLPQRLISCLQVLDTILHPEFPTINGIVSSFILPKLEDGIQNLTNDLQKKLSLTESIGQILGINESQFASRKDTTLSELGLDSLMVTEVKQLLERNNQLQISIIEIRRLTWKKLMDLEIFNLQ